jgi:hypothetical protein
MQRLWTTLRLGTAAAAFALLAGCAAMTITGTADVDKAAFGSKKRYAVVTIASHDTFTGEKGLFNAFKSGDSIAGANTQPMIDKLAPRVMSTLARTGHLSLVSQARVLSHPAYRAAQEDSREHGVAMFTMAMNVAQGYRYFSEPQKYAQLARDLGVDGVIAVQVHFSVSAASLGGGFNGMAFGRKTYSASATASAVAYNQKGEIVWKDSTTKEAEPGDARAIIVVDTSGFTGADFAKMQPSAVEVGANAFEVLVARFDDTMAGRSVERIQSVK